MYSIFVDGTCFYNDTYSDEDYRLVEPKLKLSDSNAGSLEFTMTPNSVGYNLVKRMESEIIVYRDGVEIWSGRAISEASDFWNNKKIFCEGELAYLNDTTQPQYEYHETVRGFLSALIQRHNAKASADKRFTVGSVTVTDNNDSIYRFTNYETTLEAINDKLVSRLGGHLRIRKVNGVRYLDYLKDYPRSNTQVIRFGENLLDFAKNFDMTEYCTVLLPRGAQLEEADYEQLPKYLTIESVNSGSPYLQVAEAVQKYGWIERIVDWSDVTEPQNLKTKGKQYLSEVQFDDMQLEISAIDLHYLNPEIQGFEVLDEIRCISEPHGMDKLFPLTEVEIPLNNPENTKYRLGSHIQISLTASNTATNMQLIKRIDQLPTRQNVLEEAKKNATEIMNMATNGYVTTVISDGHAQEIIISDNPDYTQATKLWRWNLNGLGYSNEGYEGEFGLAITMNGEIVADFITAGTLNANIVRAGVLQDRLGYNYWDLDTGEFSLSPNTSIGDSTIQEYIDQSGDAVLAQAEAYTNQQAAIIQQQIDGAIESYYYDYEPTNNNQPASSWTTDTEKLKHEGDIFFWKSRGWAYRYMRDENNQFKWQLIQDSDVTAAIAKANEALGKVEGKITTYAQNSKPTTNLAVGDIWINTANQNIMYRWNGSSWVNVRDSLIIEADNKASLAKKEVDKVNNELKILQQMADEMEAELGHNILRGTNDVSSLTASGEWKLALWRSASGGTGSRTSMVVSNRPQENIYRGWRLNNASDTTNKSTDIAQDNVEVENGVKYTMSCYAKGTGTLYMAYGFDRWLNKQFTLNRINTWTRFTWTITVSSAANNNKYLNKNGKSHFYFGNRGVGTIEICGLQLEIGSEVHDYQPASVDGAVKALREATTQQAIFNSLTNNGKVQGIKLSNGNLYINASYINSGTLSANYLRTGLITDKKGLNKWNLDNGVMDLKVQKLQIKSGNSWVNMDPKSIRLSASTIAWKATNSSMTEGGTLTCKGARVEGLLETGDYNNGSYFKMQSGRIQAYYKKTEIGFFGTNHYAGNTNAKGLVFDLEYKGYYMAWSNMDKSTDKSYTYKLVYSSKAFGPYKADRLNLGCNIDMQNYKLENIGGTLTKKFTFAMTKRWDSDGTANSLYNNCYLEFRNGLLVGASMP